MISDSVFCSWADFLASVVLSAKAHFLIDVLELWLPPQGFRLTPWRLVEATALGMMFYSGLSQRIGIPRKHFCETDDVPWRRLRDTPTWTKAGETKYTHGGNDVGHQRRARTRAVARAHPNHIYAHVTSEHCCMHNKIHLTNQHRNNILVIQSKKCDYTTVGLL